MSILGHQQLRHMQNCPSHTPIHQVWQVPLCSLSPSRQNAELAKLRQDCVRLNRDLGERTEALQADDEHRKALEAKVSASAEKLAQFKVSGVGWSCPPPKKKISTAPKWPTTFDLIQPQWRTTVEQEVWPCIPPVLSCLVGKKYALYDLKVGVQNKLTMYQLGIMIWAQNENLGFSQFSSPASVHCLSSSGLHGWQLIWD